MSSPQAHRPFSPVASLVFLLAGLLGTISLFSTWFHPTAPDTADGGTVHAWTDGKLGVIGPLAAMFVGLAGIMSLRSSASRTPGNRDDVKTAASAGLLAIVMPLIAYLFVGFQYEVQSCSTGFTSFGCSTKDLRDVSGASYGPQSGFVLCIIAGVLCLIGAAILRATPAGPLPATGPSRLSQLAAEMTPPAKPTLSEVAADMTRPRRPSLDKPATPAPTRPPGTWAADPYGRHQLRYYDGTRWTEHVHNGDVPGTDAV